MKRRKLLSIILALSMIASFVIVPQTASAANPWKNVLYKDFSSADQLTNDGVQAGEAGFIAHNSAFTYDSTNGWLTKTNATRWDYSLGGNYAAPNVIRYSFDVKLDDTANYYFSVWAHTWDQWDIDGVQFTQFGGEAIRRNEWQHYNIEFIPSDTAANQQIKIWRGDSSYYSSAVTKTYGYANSRTRAAWLRFEQKTAPTSEALFDNFKVEKFMFLPTVTSVTFTDVLGNEITDLSEPITPSIASVSVGIENAASLAEIEDNFSIYNDKLSTDVAWTGVSYTNNVFTATLDNGLSANCDYILSIDQDLENGNGETGDGAYIEFSTGSAAVSATLRANAPDTYAADKWKTQWSKTFDTSSDFALDGEYQVRAGFVQIPNVQSGFVSMEYDSVNKCMKTQSSGTPEFSVHVPVQYDSSSQAIVAMPDRVRYSFDVKLPDENGLEAAGDFYVQIYGLKETTNSTFRFSEFGGEAVKRNEWQRYTMEIIPNNQTNSEQHVKLWRGDESYYASAYDKVYAYKVAGYNYAHWIRVIRRAAGVSGTDDVYFDNFKLERRRYIFTCDFSQPSYSTVSQNSGPNGVPGFLTLNGTITDGQQLRIDASNGNTELMRVWLAGLYTSARPVKFSFDLKTDDENLINLLIRFGAQTADVSSTYVVNGDTNVGGATFSPGVWQRYNFIIVPAASAGGNHTITAWRGTESDRGDAIQTTFVMPNNRTNISNISLINGIAAEATYYIDNVVAERFYDDGFEVTNPQITGAAATIDNSVAQYAGTYLLILAGFNDDRLEDATVERITFTASNTTPSGTVSATSGILSCEKVMAFLWDESTLEPLTSFIEIE